MVPLKDGGLSVDSLYLLFNTKVTTMDRYPRSNGSIVERAGSGIQAYMAQVYGWMTCGLLLTAVVAWYAANTPSIILLCNQTKYCSLA